MYTIFGFYKFKQLKTISKLKDKLQNIIDKMKEDGHIIEKKQINLPSGAIKELGTYRANISLHPEVACDIEIIAERSEDTEETV